MRRWLTCCPSSSAGMRQVESVPPRPIGMTPTIRSTAEGRWFTHSDGTNAQLRVTRKMAKIALDSCRRSQHKTHDAGVSIEQFRTNTAKVLNVKHHGYPARLIHLFLKSVQLGFRA